MSAHRRMTACTRSRFSGVRCDLCRAARGGDAERRFPAAASCRARLAVQSKRARRRAGRAEHRACRPRCPTASSTSTITLSARRRPARNRPAPPLLVERKASPGTSTSAPDHRRALQRLQLHELSRQPLHRGVQLLDAADRVDLRQLGRHLRVVQRVQRILVVHLRDQQLQEAVLGVGARSFAASSLASARAEPTAISRQRAGGRGDCAEVIGHSLSWRSRHWPICSVFCSSVRAVFMHFDVVLVRARRRDHVDHLLHRVDVAVGHVAVGVGLRVLRVVHAARRASLSSMIARPPARRRCRRAHRLASGTPPGAPCRPGRRVRRRLSALARLLATTFSRWLCADTRCRRSSKIVNSDMAVSFAFRRSVGSLAADRTQDRAHCAVNEAQAWPRSAPSCRRSWRARGPGRRCCRPGSAAR